MKAAILCPGPSLADFSGTDADIAIGINRAVSHYPCDFHVFLDCRAFYAAEPVNEPCLVTTRQMYRRVTRKRPEALQRLFLCRDRLTTGTAAKWGRFSVTSALILAENLGATEIECFGCDMEGTKDWDGHAFEQDRRDEKRWREERELWQQLTAYLAERGCAVRRMEAAHAH